MAASFIKQITREMIETELAKVSHATVNSMGRSFADLDKLSDLADEKRYSLTVEDVLPQLSHEIYGDTPTDEIHTAISLACEPEDMPENSCVELYFA